MQNAIVYRCVRMIAEAAASVPLCLYEGDAEITEHPLLDLLARPSPGQTGTDLLEAFYGYLLVSGTSYLEAVALGGQLRALHALRPDRMKVIPGPDGWPEAWEYSVGGTTVRIDGEVAPGVRPVLQLKLFHPLNDHYGLSPIEAAATAIDLHNAASRWNKALLDIFACARPAGQPRARFGQADRCAGVLDRRAFERRPVRAAEIRAGGELPGRAQRGICAAANAFPKPARG